MTISRRTKSEIAKDKREKMKTCTACGVRKVFEKFHKADDAPDGRTSRCASCANVISKRTKRVDDPTDVQRLTTLLEHTCEALHQQGGEFPESVKIWWKEREETERKRCQRRDEILDLIDDADAKTLDRIAKAAGFGR